MFRFSRQYANFKASQEVLDEARRAMQQEKIRSRRWRRRHPKRDPSAYFKEWNINKLKTSKNYMDLMVRFMSISDGLSEANQMMRFGMEAPGTDIEIEPFSELAQNVFILKLFETLADQAELSQYSRELVLQRLVPKIFPNMQIPLRKRDFAAEIVSGNAVASRNA